MLALISNNKLIPNSSYRITDYTTTTAQADTQSAGHDFDIVVTALSTNELSEIASCVRKADDTYFANSNLKVWEIKYCIDNNTTRFAWADAVNGKGVIYYMKDEWNNECPYDFKNIQFKKAGVFLHTFGGAADDSLTGGCHHNTMMDYKSSSVLTLNFNTFGTGCRYNTFGTGCRYNTFGNNCQNNTFSDGCGSNKFGNDCKYNTCDYCGSNTFGDSCSSNTFGFYCQNNTFGNDCKYNTFGGYCHYTSFGDGCNSNTFGFYCQNNTFSNSCSSNTFGDYCGSNSFSDSCSNNTFGNNCSTNTFGNNCSSNTFGTGCSSNSFSDNCSSNTFGNSCSSNTFGYECKSNTFSDDCGSNKFSAYYRYNSFGNGCSYNNFYTGTSGTTQKNYIRYIVLEDGCAYNNFYSSLTTSSSLYLQRIRIKGLQNTTATTTQITLSATNTKYEWLICYTSSSVSKQYCPNN